MGWSMGVPRGQVCDIGSSTAGGAAKYPPMAAMVYMRHSIVLCAIHALIWDYFYADGISPGCIPSLLHGHSPQADSLSNLNLASVACIKK